MPADVVSVRMSKRLTDRRLAGRTGSGRDRGSGSAGKSATPVASAAEDDDLGERERVGMRDGEARRSPADCGEAECRTAVQPQLRWAVAAHDFEVPPQHALRVAGTEGLHGRFLGREAAGEVNGRHAAPHAVGDFAFGEDTMGEPLSVSLDGVADAGDVGGVESEPDNVHVTQA